MLGHALFLMWLGFHSQKMRFTWSSFRFPMLAFFDFVQMQAKGWFLLGQDSSFFFRGSWTMTCPSWAARMDLQRQILKKMKKTPKTSKSTSVARVKWKKMAIKLSDLTYFSSFFLKMPHKLPLSPSFYFDHKVTHSQKMGKSRKPYSNNQ